MRWPLVLRRRFETVERDNDRLRIENANLRGSNKGLLEQNAELRGKLKIASKNDQRDKHGRFTKGKD